ncbi:MAG: YhbY family RNA-binding protein [Clostridia bacterium]|nr:YhbY family RNA-binding protein [Clostridia bacterium]
MTTKERAEIRSKAMALKSIFQIGKNGINANQVQAIDDSLEALELLKVNVLETAEEDVHNIAIELAEKTHSTLIQVVGNKVTLYRKSKKEKKQIIKKTVQKDSNKIRR